ncbi:MAG: hypothetical protein AAB870_00960 [Patescibacteria group bacterium]
METDIDVEEQKRAEHFIKMSFLPNLPMRTNMRRFFISLKNPEMKEEAEHFVSYYEKQNKERGIASMVFRTYFGLETKENFHAWYDNLIVSKRQQYLFPYMIKMVTFLISLVHK